MEKHIRQIKVYQERKIRIPISIPNINPGDSLVIFTHGDLIIISADKNIKKFRDQNKHVAEFIFERNNIKVSNNLVDEIMNKYIVQTKSRSPAQKFFKFIKDDLKKTDELLLR